MLGSFVNLQSAHAVNHTHRALPCFGLWDGLLLTWWTYWSCNRGATTACWSRAEWSVEQGRDSLVVDWRASIARLLANSTAGCTCSRIGPL
jgi:hypothetical protein